MFKFSTPNLATQTSDAYVSATPVGAIKPTIPPIPQTGKFSMSQLAQANNQSYSPEQITQALGQAETRGVQNPYSFSRPSGDKNLGDALGKYQVTEGELKTYGGRYLPKPVTREQFLTSPQLQDLYMRNKVADMQARGIPLDDIISNHRGGINSKVSDYQSYVDSVKTFLPKNGGFQFSTPSLTTTSQSSSQFEPEKRSGGFNSAVEKVLSIIDKPRQLLRNVDIGLGGIGLPQLGSTKLGTIQDALKPKNPEEAAKQGLANIGSEQNPVYIDFTGFAGELDNIAKHGLEAVASKISKELKPLAQEARKYRSAEEFVKNNTVTAYRGGEVRETSKFWQTEGSGIYIASDPKLAEGFSNGTKVKEVSFARPKNVLEAPGDELIGLQHGSKYREVFEPIKSTDSEWMKIHKQARINIEAKDPQAFWPAYRVEHPNEYPSTKYPNYILDTSESADGIRGATPLLMEEVDRLIKEAGYDAVHVVGADVKMGKFAGKTDWWIIKDKSLLENPKSQLTDLYNQATKATSEVPSMRSTGSRISAPLDTEAQRIPPLHSEEGLSSIKPIIRGKDINVKDKVNVLDYFRTPEKVLQKIGLGEEAKLLRTADEAYKKDLITEFKYLQSLREKVPNQESSQKIFQWLDGQAVELSSAERQVADELKGYLKNWADKLNLPEDKRIASYITHIFDPDFIAKEFDPELAKLIVDRVPGSVYDPFLEQRLGKLGYKEDVWSALDAYVKRATRKFNFDPALEVLSNSARKLDLESYDYVRRLAANINMRPTTIDNLVDNAIKSVFGYKFTQRPTSFLTTKWRKIIYRGTLGLNVGSALRNLTQGVNTYATLGEKYTVLGYLDLLRNGTGELFENGVLSDNLISDRGLSVAKKFWNQADAGMFKLFDLAEKINRGSAYYGAKKKALAKGLTEEKAIEFAKEVVRKTQFQFGKIDTPVALSSDIAKTVAQLQTYNVKQAEFLGEMIKSKDVAGMIRFIGGSLTAIHTIGQLFGMSYKDLLPSFRIGGSPLGKTLGGIASQFSSNEQTRTQGKTDLKNTSVLLIPGGAQLKKTYQGIKAYNQGKDTTPTGRTRFNIQKTPLNLLRAGLFGKSTLPAAQNYYNNLGKKSSAQKSSGGFKFSTPGL